MHAIPATPRVPFPFPRRAPARRPAVTRLPDVLPELDDETPLSDVSDDALALALRHVSWNERDVRHFLRRHRLGA